MKIALCTPRCGPPSWHYHDSVVRWQIHHYTEHPEIGALHLHPARALPIDVARNLLVDQFLRTDADYLWFVDQDAAFLTGTLDRLLSRNLPIVGALEMMRLPECCFPMARADAAPGGNEAGQHRVQAPEVYRFIGQHYEYTSNSPQMLGEPPKDSLLLTRFTGCHCLLIERSVVERMEAPWFQGYNPGGEDQYFCEKAAEMGVATYVDMSVLVGHASTDRIIGAFDFMSGFRFLDELERLEHLEHPQDATLTEWNDASP